MFLSFILAFVTVSLLTIPVFALSWDGSSAGGGGGGSPAGPNGYAIRYTDDNDLVGYRFSLVDKSGANKVSKSIDVFLNNYFGNYDYDYAYKFSVKYNKKQMIANQNGNFSTSLGQVNCYKETSMGFATALPVPSGLEIWQNNTTNLNKVLSKLGAGSLTNLKNGDKILVEPIWSVRLESVFHALTVTEIAIYGKYILGATSDGGASYTSDSWGFISEYTNKFFPNALYTPNGQGLWTGVSAASSRLSFYNIINKGYGVGIAYNETKADFSPVLNVQKCEAWPGSVGTRNSNHFGISTGNAFANWTYGHGYPKAGDTIWYAVYFPPETENISVQQTVWINSNSSATRKTTSDSGKWYDVSISPTTVENDKSFYTVKARVDWIDSNGKVRKYGTEKSFYIPLKPIIKREQVTAINAGGTIQATSGTSGQSGKLYFGESVSFKYVYGADSDWSSYNDISGTASRWNGSSWVNIRQGGNDYSETKVAISKTNTVRKNSSLQNYVIPLPAKEDDNSYLLRFKLVSAWNPDPAHTSESTVYDIPIVKSDVELLDIKLIDSTGYYVDKDSLTVGDTIKVRYVYMNNTDCDVFVKGYNNDGSAIDGTYKIRRNGKISVDGGSFVVPDEKSFDIWGGVYLDTVEKGNTEYETDGANNEKLIECSVFQPLYLEAVEPNASYREGTDVISSYQIINPGNIEVLPSDNVSVRLRVFKPGDDAPFVTLFKDAVVPSSDFNLIYFKWTVPENLCGKDLTLLADIFDGDKYYSEILSVRSTVPYEYFNTPDTRYEERPPEGYAVPNGYTAKSLPAYWYEYSYEDGEFVKTRYGLSVASASSNTAYPATGETATQKMRQWVMKSGYAFSVSVFSKVSSISYAEFPENDSSYTVPQYAYTAYPEYVHSEDQDKISTLELKNENGEFVFVFPEYYDNGRVHFIPLWFPNKNYVVKVFTTDCWTPSGMIFRSFVLPSLKISGNAYDDWYAGRR